MSFDLMTLCAPNVLQEVCNAISVVFLPKTVESNPEDTTRQTWIVAYSARQLDSSKIAMS